MAAPNFPGVSALKLQLLALASLAIMAPAASASVITFRFDGTVDSNSLHTGEWAFAHAGDSFSVQYAFDTAATDSDPDPGVGNYPASISSFAVIAGSGFETGSSGGILVINSPVGDSYAASLALLNNLVGRVSLDDASGAARADDLLPHALDFADWQGRVFTIGTSDGQGDRLLGTITSFSVVPAPAAVGIAGVALIAPIRRRR